MAATGASASPAAQRSNSPAQYADIWLEKSHNRWQRISAMTKYIQGKDGKMRGSIPTAVPAPTPAPTLFPVPNVAIDPDINVLPTVEDLHAKFRAHQAGKASASPRLTRAEGYRKGAPKEAEGLNVAEDFLNRLLQLTPGSITRIEGAEENYRNGDFRLPNGKTIEVKRQPINPDRYPMNFVEVGELTFNPRHYGGAAALAQLLNIDSETLAASTVKDFRSEGHPSAPFGRPDHVSVSLTSIAGSQATIYVNPDQGHLYIYRRDEIIDHVRRAVLNNNLRRGQGNSNDDGLAVLVPLARWRFSKDKQGLWRYTGLGGSAEAEKSALRQYLN